jgi:biotin operon repressor
MATTEELLAEIMRWQRAAVLPEVRKTIESALTAKTADATKKLRTAYEMCDGTRPGSEIAAALGVSNQSISNWTRRWRELGIAHETDDRRIRHLVSLDALGLPLEPESEH